MPGISLTAERWGNTFRVSTCAPVGFTLEWLVYSTIMPSLCLYNVITGPPGYYYYSLLKKTRYRGPKGMLLYIV